jgi:hypothetical protein
VNEAGLMDTLCCPSLLINSDRRGQSAIFLHILNQQAHLATVWIFWSNSTIPPAEMKAVQTQQKKLLRLQEYCMQIRNIQTARMQQFIFQN